MATKKRDPKQRAKKLAAINRPIPANIISALHHAQRCAILEVMATHEPISPNELSKILDEGLSQVSYHVKCLMDFDCIAMVKTEPRRGAVEHYYQRTAQMAQFQDDGKALNAIAEILKNGKKKTGKAIVAEIRQVILSTNRKL